MYDSFLSDQWVFDRCIEASMFKLPYVFLLIGLLLSMLYPLNVYGRMKRSGKKNVAWLVGVTLLTTPVVFGIYVFVFIIFSFSVCSFGRGMWPAIRAAHEVNVEIQEQYKKTGEWPKSEQELSLLKPNVYEDVVENSKTHFVYDGDFTWFVRPNEYFVMVFDSQRSYGFFQICDRYCFSDRFNKYPPNYDGPWDELPE